MPFRVCSIKTGLLLSMLWFSQASAEVIIDILGGQENRLPFSILPFQVADTKQRGIVENIVTNNLIKSGYFRYVDLAEAAATRSLQNINYRFYQAANIENLLSGKITATEDGSFDIEVHLFDILLRQKTWSYRWNFPADSLRYSAHLISDLMFRSIIGKTSSFTSRLTYVHVDFLSTQKRKYSIFYADSDGANQRRLISSSMPIISPTWSPDGQSIAYVSYENNRPEIVIHDIFSGQRRTVVSFNGSNSSPSWSPDGRFLAMSLSKDGNPNIYELELATNQLTQITNHSGINTEPTYTADGQNILFTSNRLGKPSLFSYSRSAKTTQLLSNKIITGYAASVSTDPDLVGFLSADQDNFNIALYNRQEDVVDLLTNSQLNESPTLSKHGLFMLFSQQNANQNSTTMYLVDTLTRTRRVIKTLKGEIKNLAWGPPQNLSKFN